MKTKMRILTAVALLALVTGASPLLAQLPTLTIQDCDGNTITTIDNPLVAGPLYNFVPPIDKEFAFWNATLPVVDPLNSMVTLLFSPLPMDVTITASCDPLYKLDLTDAVSLTPSLPGGYYQMNTVVTIQANIPAGANFTGWAADKAAAVFGDATNPTTTIDMTDDFTVTAVYSIPQPPASPTKPDPTCARGFADIQGIWQGEAFNDEDDLLGSVKVQQGTVGKAFEFCAIDDGMSADDAPGPDAGTFAGFEGNAAAGRTLDITSNQDGAYSVTVSIVLSADELTGLSLDGTQLEMHVLDTTQSPTPGVWTPAGTNLGASAPTGVVGESGYVANADGSFTYWTTVNHLSFFAVGQRKVIPTEPPAEPPVNPPAQEEEPNDDSSQTIPDETDDTADEQQPACGLGTLQGLLFGLVGLAMTQRRRWS